MRPEPAPFLSSYLSSPTVGHCLSVYDLSSPMCCHILGFGYPVLYLHLVKSSLFSHLQVLSCFLVSFLPFFMPEKIGLRQAVR
jgi:hypothetical protein